LRLARNAVAVLVLVTMALFAATLLVSCKIRVIVPPEGGSVTTSSGAYSCASGKTCDIDVVDFFFDETFIAKPSSGYEFKFWKKGPGRFCGRYQKPCRVFTAGIEEYTELAEVILKFLESDETFYLQPVFAKQGTWNQLGDDIDSEQPTDVAGKSVSLSADGSRVAIGAPYNDGNGSDSGHVRVYALSGNAWQQLGADIDGEERQDHSGTSVSLSADGNRLAIGAPDNSGNGNFAGQVRVYDWSGTEWVQLGGDIDGDNILDRFGYSVSLSADGKLLAIGSAQDDFDSPPSYVRVYKYSPQVDTWLQRGSDLIGVGNDDNYGISVSLSADGKRLAIGAPDNDDNGTDSGEVTAYQWSGADWVQMGGDLNGKGEDDRFGYSVSLSADGRRLAIGAPEIERFVNSYEAGYVRVYGWSGTAWSQLGVDIAGKEASESSGRGVSLSADGNRVAISSPYYLAGPGHVRVYRYAALSGVWQQLGQGIDATDDDFSLNSVSLSANAYRLAIGEVRSNNPDRVRVFEMRCAVAPPAADPMEVCLISPARGKKIPQNNPTTGCTHYSGSGYGLLVDFDWTDAKSPVGIAGYHLYAISRIAPKPIIDTFITGSDFTWVSCRSYVVDSTASMGFIWTVQAEDNNGKLGPVSDEGFFRFEQCRLDNGEACGTN
jgi:hypothetical protein